MVDNCSNSAVFGCPTGLALQVQDLANQIAFSTQYRTAVKNANKKRGQYLAVPAAEYFSGGDSARSVLSLSLNSAKFFWTPNIARMGFLIVAGLPAGWSSPEPAIGQKLAAEVRSTFGKEAVNNFLKQTFPHCFLVS